MTADIKPEEIPTAHQVADAIVIAAEILNRRECLPQACDASDPFKIPLRVRQLAGVALGRLFPLYPVSQLAKCVNLLATSSASSWHDEITEAVVNKVLIKWLGRNA